ncbi:MAG: CDP-alcohol phosphatidyltransferase family protein [Nannocystaceae bacterium]
MPAPLLPAISRLNLASLITSTSIALAMAAILLAHAGEVAAAVTCAAFCLPCDALDGQVARRLNQVTAFGGALDSLADGIAFLVAPALVGASLVGLDGVGLVVTIPFVLGGLWRLARFAEVGTTGSGGRECFEGVPTPFIAAFFVILAPVLQALGGWGKAMLILFFLISPLLMCSSLPIPKRGLHTRAMWFCLPAALVVLWLRP